MTYRDFITSSPSSGSDGEGPSYLQAGGDITRLPGQRAADGLPRDGPTDAAVPAGLHPLLGSRFVSSS